MLSSAESRAISHIGHRWPQPAVRFLGPGHIDSVSREHFRDGLQVQCRHGLSGADSVSMHNFALEGEWPVEQPAGSGYFPGFDQPPDLARRKQRPPPLDPGNHLHRKAQTDTQLLEQSNVTSVFMPEPEIFSHQYGFGPQRP